MPRGRCGPGPGVLAHVVVDVGGQRDLHLRRVPDLVVVMVMVGMEQPWRARLADRGCGDVGTRRLRAWRPACCCCCRWLPSRTGAAIALQAATGRRGPGPAGRRGIHHRDGCRGARAGRHRRTQRGHRREATRWWLRRSGARLIKGGALMLYQSQGSRRSSARWASRSRVPDGSPGTGLPLLVGGTAGMGGVQPDPDVFNVYGLSFALFAPLVGIGAAAALERLEAQA